MEVRDIGRDSDGSFNENSNFGLTAKGQRYLDYLTTRETKSGLSRSSSGMKGLLESFGSRERSTSWETLEGAYGGGAGFEFLGREDYEDNQMDEGLDRKLKVLVRGGYITRYPDSW